MKRALMLCGVLAVAASAVLGAEPSRLIYNPRADARELIRSAVAKAARDGKNVVLIFGANW